MRGLPVLPDFALIETSLESISLKRVQAINYTYINVIRS